MADDERDGGPADRSFDEVRGKLTDWEAHYAAALAARNLWVRRLPPGSPEGQAEVRALPAGERPDDPAFVAIPAPESKAIADLWLPLAATARAFLLPLANDPARIAAMRAGLREQLGRLLDPVLDDAEKIATELAAQGLGGDPDRGEAH